MMVLFPYSSRHDADNMMKVIFVSLSLMFCKGKIQRSRQSFLSIFYVWFLLLSFEIIDNLPSLSRTCPNILNAVPNSATGNSPESSLFLLYALVTSSICLATKSMRWKFFKFMQINRGFFCESPNYFPQSPISSLKTPTTRMCSTLKNAFSLR